MALQMGRSLLRQRIKEANARRSANDRVTQRSIAAALGVSESFIAMVANGQRELSLERAANVAHLLGCGVMDLNEWHERKGSSR